MENLNSTLWMQTAVEYPAVARQVYALAALKLEAALKPGTAYYMQLEPEKTEVNDQRGLAVVLDLDETVVDNSAYQASLVKEQRFYGSDTWQEWTRHESDYRAVPGALDFLRRVDDFGKGIKIFYVSNRSCKVKKHQADGSEVCEQLKHTQHWMQQHGFPQSNDISSFMFGNDRWGNASDNMKDGDKSARRAAIAKDYRIIMMVGDQLGDFIGEADQKLAGDARFSRMLDDVLGERWFLLPNPSYGSWLLSMPKACVDSASGSLLADGPDLPCYTSHLDQKMGRLRVMQ